MRIGILGGTFDPIHFGHIRPALAIKQQLGLDKIWLMPNKTPPHKNSTQTSALHRQAMVERVCQQYPDFELCDIELTLTGPSYTSNTLNLLRQLYPQHQFLFIMGMDSFVNLPKWHQWQQLFELTNLIICQRPGWQLTSENPMLNELCLRKANIRQLSSTDVGKIIPVDIQLEHISSTQIRQAIITNLQVSTLLPDNVLSYIQQHHLYSL